MRIADDDIKLNAQVAERLALVPVEAVSATVFQIVRTGPVQQRGFIVVIGGTVFEEAICACMRGG